MRLAHLVTLAALMLIGTNVRADNLSIPNSFVSNTPALASEVNANFSAVEIEVDANDARISSLEAQTNALDASDGAPADAVFVDTIGKVGIGTTTPIYRLSLETNDLFGDDARGMIHMIPGSSQGRVYISSTIGLLDFLKTNASGGFLDYLTITAKSFATGSSRETKTDIRPLEGALDKVKRLRGVRFNWKADGIPDIGLIAEEVNEVVPEVVEYGDDGTSAKALDYSRLVALLIEALKEQQRIIEHRGDELAAYHAEVRATKQEMERLKLRVARLGDSFPRFGEAAPGPDAPPTMLSESETRNTAGGG